MASCDGSSVVYTGRAGRTSDGRGRPGDDCNGIETVSVSLSLSQSQQRRGASPECGVEWTKWSPGWPGSDVQVTGRDRFARPVHNVGSWISRKYRYPESRLPLTTLVFPRGQSTTRFAWTDTQLDSIKGRRCTCGEVVVKGRVWDRITTQGKLHRCGVSSALLLLQTAGGEKAVSDLPNKMIQPQHPSNSSWPIQREKLCLGLKASYGSIVLYTAAMGRYANGAGVSLQHMVTGNAAHSLFEFV